MITDGKLMREQHGSGSTLEGQSPLSFSNYDLVRRIDVGGMGEVYLARQRSAFDHQDLVANKGAQFFEQLTAVSKKSAVLCPNVAAITFDPAQPGMSGNSN